MEEIKKTQNRIYVEEMFKYLEVYGVKTKDIMYGDTYFVFDLGEDAVINFKVVGLKNWYFGIWISLEDEKMPFTVFAQHKDNIDKFKPSRSALKVVIDKYALEETWDSSKKVGTGVYSKWGHVLQLILAIKNHPFISYYQDLYENLIVHEKNIVFKLIRNKYREKRNNVVEWITTVPLFTLLKLKAKVFKNAKVISKIEVKDKGKHWYPRYDVYFTFKEGSTENQEYWFLRIFFPEYFKYRRNFSFDLFKVGSDERFSYSK